MSGRPSAPPPAYSNTDASPASDSKGAPSHPPPTSDQGSLDKNQKQYYQILKNIIITKKLQSFYSTDSQIMGIAKKLNAESLSTVSKLYNIKPRSAKLLVQLSLFDVILFLDNSASMNEGDRIDELEQIVSTIVDCYLPFDTDGKGLSLIFMNGDTEDDFVGVKSKDEVAEIIQDTLYYGETPLASVMDKKIITPLKQKISNNPETCKPTLIICLTDGSPTDKNVSTENLIKDIKTYLSAHHRPSGVFFQFAQIGNDLASADFLQRLDEHKAFGDIVDVTSSYEVEQRQVVSKGGELNRSMWTLKLLLGAIDNEFDFIDEKKL